MSDKPVPSDATVQMSPEEVARLHQQLAKENKQGAAPPVDADAPTVRASAPQLAPAPSPRPAAPVSAQPSSGGSTGIAGGIGALVVVASMVFGLLPKMQGMGNDFLMPHVIAGAVGYLMLATALFGSAGRTSGVGGIAGVFSLLLGLVYTSLLLAEAEVFALGDIAEFVLYGTFFGPPATWLFIAIWAFAGVRPLSPGLGIPAGIFGMIGGAAGGAAYGMLMSGSFGLGDQDDTFMALDMTALGGMAVAAILVAIAFFGPVAKARKR